MNGKILIVDDEVQIAAAAQVRLASAGYETVVAHDGLEGMQCAICEQPDAIVLDVRMPQLDGMATLKQLRQAPETSQIPVVMVSASVVDEKAALDAGASFFIRKPFAGPRLIDAVNAVTTNESTLTEVTNEA